MPFLPFVLLLAWQAISKSASFALGWATAIYFGQVPGKQGRILAVISLASAACHHMDEGQQHAHPPGAAGHRRHHGPGEVP